MGRGLVQRSYEWLVDLAVAGFSILLGLSALGNAVSPPAEQPGSYRYVTLTFGAMMIVIGCGFLIRLYRRRRDSIRFYKFALSNQLTAKFDEAPAGESGMIFGLGHSRRVVAKLELKQGVQIANYRYVTGRARERKVHQWAYVRIVLPRNLPHMVLDAKRNNALGLSNLDVSFRGTQKLSLEGDFDRYFTLYAPKQYERDALYVFTPDVMQILIEQAKNFDIEIVDNVLYVYKLGRFQLGDAALYRQLLPIVSTIAAKLLHQVDYYADERISDRSQDMIARQGARLKRRRYSVITAIGFVLVVAAYVVRVVIELQS